MLTANEDLRRLVHERASEAALRESALAGGMQLMREDGQRLVATGITSLEEVVRVTRD